LRLVEEHFLPFAHWAMRNIVALPGTFCWTGARARALQRREGSKYESCSS
jgi:hypothetical protein